MADDKSRKQATLGYVRDSQITLGCVHFILTGRHHSVSMFSELVAMIIVQFANTLRSHCRRFFGSNSDGNQAPKKQTTLSFGGTRQRVSSGTEDKSADAPVKTESEEVIDENGTEPFQGLKREKIEEAEESDDSDVQPVSKRRRKITENASSPARKKRSTSPKKSRLS